MLSFSDPGPTARPASDANAPGGANGAVPRAVSFGPSKIAGIKASLLGDQTYMLMPQLIPCVMDTAINSTFEGPIECHIDRDIKPRGITLLGRGSIVHGYYKGTIQEGQTRLFAAIDWVQDPATGCVVSFDNAPISDGVGQTGMTGNIDTRFFQRFGAALAVTGFQSMVQLLQAEIQKNSSGNTNLSLGGGGVESLAGQILRKQIEIPPIITTHQGDTVAIFLVRPLDFSDCYTLVLKDR